MCGIVGYVGAGQAAPVLLEGLERLEYRGYDSAGIAVMDEGAIRVSKVKGRIAKLYEKTEGGVFVRARWGSGIRDGRRMARRRIKTRIRT